MEKELKKIIRESAVNGKLPCAKAFFLAGKYNVSIGKVGETADEEGIKISNCQLGCF